MHELDPRAFRDLFMKVDERNEGREKVMRDLEYVSTACVAEALGVSVTTVKRWVDQGVLAAHRTVGGHRKILRQDVLRLVGGLNLPRTKLHLLRGEAANDVPPDEIALASRLHEALLKGDSATVRTVLLGAYRAGIASAALADRVIAPVMRKIGHAWAEGTIDTYQEHRGTRLCLEALLELKRKLVRPAHKQRPLAVGGAPEHDHYQLAGVLVELVLLDSGWRVVNLGPHTPLASLSTALDELRPQLVWLSVSHIEEPTLFLPQMKNLSRAVRAAGVDLVVGGRAISPDVRAQIAPTIDARSLTDLSAAASTLARRWRAARRKGDVQTNGTTCPLTIND